MIVNIVKARGVLSVCQPPQNPYKGNKLWLVETLFGVTVYRLLTAYTYIYIW